jgi:hypothetical protein
MTVPKKLIAAMGNLFLDSAIQDILLPIPVASLHQALHPPLVQPQGIHVQVTHNVAVTFAVQIQNDVT